MKARRSSTCEACTGSIRPGQEIKKDCGAWVHAGCAASGDPAGDREYLRGAQEANRYLSDRAIYGAELADAWELDREMREAFDY